MRIQHNIMAMNAYRNYTNNVSAMKANLEKLSSGYKINRAGDDAAGLAISEKMRAQITGLETAQKNAKDGISLVQTAEGALTEVHDMLNRMVELATQSANGTYDNTTDRKALEQELNQLKDEINRISKATNFNGIDLLSGNYATKSASAVGELLNDAMIDGTNPTAAGAAVININLKDANAAAASTVEVGTTTDGSAVAAAVPGEITIKMGGLAASDVSTIASSMVHKNSSGTASASVPAINGISNGDTLELSIGGNTVTVNITGTTDDAGKVTAINTALNPYGITAKDDGSGNLQLEATESSIGKTGVLVDAAGSDVTITKGTTAANIKDMYVDVSGTKYKIGDFFEVELENDNSGAIQNGSSIKLTAKVGGDLTDGNGTAVSNITHQIAAAIGGLNTNLDTTSASNIGDAASSIELTNPGSDAGMAQAAAAKTEYVLDLDWSEIKGGTTLHFGADDATAKKFIFKVDGSNTNVPSGYTEVDISTCKDDAEKAAALKAVLDAHVSFGNSSGTAEFDVTLNADNTITLTGKYDATASATATTDLAKTNLGVLVSNNAAALGDSSYTPVHKTTTTSPTSPFATAEYTLGELKEGAKIYIGDKCVEVVASGTTNLKPGQVAEDAGGAANTATAIINEFAALGVDSSKISLTANAANASAGTPASTTLKITGTTAGQAGADFANSLTVKFLDADDVPDPSAVTLGGSSANTITAGTTTVDDIKKFTIGSGSNAVTLGDSFTVMVNGKAANSSYVIQEGDEITLTANQKGKLSDSVMNALKPAGDGLASAKVTNGYDEGSTAAGDKTTYQLVFDMSKLAGGNTFSIGNADGSSQTFEISIDGDTNKNGGNGTVSPDKTEVANRNSINIFNMSQERAAEEIANTIQNKMTDFDVNSQLVNGKLTVDLTAKEEGDAYNYGNIRLSSQSNAITYTEYNPAGGAANGIEGTYAQVSYKFDKDQIQSGDTLTIGDTTIYFGDENKAERVDGKTKITVSAEDAKKDLDAIVRGLESAGYRSGQVKFSESDGTMTITGIKTGESAADLAKNGAKVSLSNVNGRAMTTGGLTLQIGDTADTYNQITVNIAATDCEALGIKDISVADQEDAQAAVDVIKAAINQVSTIRGTLGATQNRLDHTINNLSVMTENIQDAESTIRDVDVAEEMMAYTKNNILIQSAQAMLAQANQVPQGVLQLLG